MKILLCVSSGIGNVIMATPMISALHQMGAEIDVFGECNFSGGHHVLKHRKEIQNVYDIMDDAGSYDAVLATVGGAKLVNRLRNVKRLAVTPCDYENMSEIENNMDLVRHLGWEGATPDCFAGYNPDLKLFKTKKIIGLHNGHHPNPVWKRKSYPYYEALVKKLSETEYDVCLFGGEHDNEDWIEEGDFLSYINKLDILDTSALISQVDVFVGTDGALTHIAAALNVKTYAIWGGTSLLKNKPPKAEIIRSEPNCPPCQKFSPMGWEKQGRWGDCTDWKCIQSSPDNILRIVL